MTTKEEIVWYPSEWNADGFSAYFKGYAADVYMTPRGIVWHVKATAEVSEWPELQDFASARAYDSGRRAAETALRRAARAR